MTDLIEIDRNGGVQTIRINRADKKNALTSPMYDAMTRALWEADEADDLRVTLILGQEGAFTAGNDISEFMSFAQTGALGAPVLGFLEAISTVEKPLIAGVDGLAIGVGTTLLFHCDMAVASDRSTFRTPFLDLGLVPEAASSLLMPRTMGYARAFEMLAMGETFDASRAQQAGFINTVVEAQGLESAARKLALDIASRPPGAMKQAKQLMRGYDREEVRQRIADEAKLFAERLASAEAREAFTAFLEKRPRNFAKTAS